MNTLIITAAVLGFVPAVVTPPDFSPITEQLAAWGPAAALALGAAFAAAVAIIAIKWGTPLIVGFFKKNAK